MKDNFKKARAKARYGRRSVRNGSARMQVKQETRKALTA